MKTLYIFVDESGNFDFSPTGTKYFILTLLSTTAPAQIGQYLLKLRYELLPNYACGENMEERGYFHASEDKQQIRDYVFALLLKHMQNFRIDAVIAQKNKANPFFHSQPTLLPSRMPFPNHRRLESPGFEAGSAEKGPPVAVFGAGKGFQSGARSRIIPDNLETASCERF